MNENNLTKQKHASFGGALITFLLCVAVILIGVIKMKLEVQIPLIGAIMVVCFYAKIFLKFSYQDLEKSMVKSLSDSLGVMLLLCTIGPLIASWIACGTVPYIIYLGLGIISPSWYLPFIVVMCAILSTVTGSSWTTMGTVGVAMLGISIGMGMSLPMTAGAILCGAYFGDKISPVSDVVVFNTGICKVDIMKHCKNLLYTTLPALICSLIVFFILGRQFADRELDLEGIRAIREGLSSQYNFSPLLWLPLLIVIVVIVLKVPAIPSLWAGVAAGGILAIVLQDIQFSDFFSYLYGGYFAETGNADIDKILNRGGITSMFNIICVVICSMSFGGVLDRTKILIVLARRIVQIAKGRFGLVLATLFTGIVASFVASDPYIAALIPTKAFEKEYDRRGLDRTLLSRTVSDSGICYAPIVPWGSNGVFVAATLGVAIGSIYMWYLMAWFTPIFTLLCAATGIGVKYTKDRKDAAMAETADEEA